MKKKLRLQIEKLRVEQFEVQPGSAVARGTVHGHSGGDVSVLCTVAPSVPGYCFDVPGSRYLYFSDCC